MQSSFWQTTRYQIDLGQPRVMGIVNVTPDSFSDGGRYDDPHAALRHCEALVEQGADLLDIGGESTRPGARTPSDAEELERVRPVLRHAVSLGVPVSVDTSSVAVMRAALDEGADIINDVRALQRPGALEAVAAHPSCGVCVMHMQGEPGVMQQQPHYTDVLDEVRVFLAQRRRAVLGAGVAAQRLVLDPGYGFGKTVAHNLELWQHQRRLLDLGQPLLVGWSRKSTLGAITGRGVEHRLAASLSAMLISVARGARIVRVHDVAATVDALKVAAAAFWPESGPLQDTA